MVHAQRTNKDTSRTILESKVLDLKSQVTLGVFVSKNVRIRVIGDYDPNLPYHVATNQALEHAAGALAVDAEIRWLPTTSLDEEQGTLALDEFDGLWCSPGSPYVSMSGALNGIRFAREHGIPFLGT